MPRIDAHQHFWQFDPQRDDWITEEMQAIRHDFLPSDLQPLLSKCGIEGTIAVQASQSENENDFLLSLAAENDCIKGVVGWTDLQSGNLEERLEFYREQKKIKGFRHVLQGEPRRDLMLSPAFMKGVGLLSAYGFTYDILVFTDQLQFIPSFVGAHPQQLFVIDHIAKPKIKLGELRDWQKRMETLANFENVYCKISGLVTEADWQHWKPADFTPYLDVVVKAFGTKRILFGSDWPVCLLAAKYEQAFALVQDYFSTFSKEEQDDFFGNNACRFYQLF